MHSTCATPLNRAKVGFMSTHRQHQARLQGRGSAIPTRVDETLVSPGLSSLTEQFHSFPPLWTERGQLTKLPVTSFDFSRLHSCPSAVPTLSSDLDLDKGWKGERRGKVGRCWFFCCLQWSL